VTECLTDVYYTAAILLNGLLEVLDFSIEAIVHVYVCSTNLKWTVLTKQTISVFMKCLKVVWRAGYFEIKLSETSNNTLSMLCNKQYCVSTVAGHVRGGRNGWQHTVCNK
jgi:hypothetical protein